MDTITLQQIKPVTSGPGHHLFGFHDLPAWNAAGDRLVALEVADIRTPPDPSVHYPVGYADEEGTFVPFGTTRTFNYPQGARQQWIGNTNSVIVNDLDKRRFISKIYDSDSRKQLATLNFPTHCLANDGWAYGLDYARLFRLGAYGYAGLADAGQHEDAPSGSGIRAHNIYTGENRLLLSVKDVAGLRQKPDSGRQHYLTHILLSPDQKRIAFLHRYKLNDGGEMTRLCTTGRDGSGLRCLAEGFLSHFDWKDDHHLMIWGRTGSGVEKLRGSLIYRMIPTQLLHFTKKMIKRVISNGGNVGKSNFHWLNLRDDYEPELSYIAEGLVTEDGHPMYCPANRDWFICDTYPDKEGIRTLFLFQVSENRRTDLGRFKMINDTPDLRRSQQLLAGTDPKVIRTVGLEKLAFTRSGIHCDLHPRWSPDGSKIAFDSIHEGTRQIYQLETVNLMR